MPSRSSSSLRPSLADLLELTVVSALALLAGACSDTGLRVVPEEAPSFAETPGTLQQLPPGTADQLPGEEEELPGGENLAPEIEVTEPVLHAVHGDDFPVILRALVADTEDPVEELRVDWEILESGEILVDGLIPSSAGEVVSAVWLEEGVYTLLATVSDSAGQTAFDIVTIAVEPVEDGQNSPPTAPGVAILPTAPEVEDDLACWVETPSVDPDGDLVSYSYEWSRDGVPTGDVAPTLPSSATETGESWTCEITPHDGQEAGPPGSASVYLELSCLLTWSVSIDGYTVIEEPANASLPGLPVNVGFTANAPAWQTAAVFVDDLDIAVPAGGPTTWSTDFSPALGSWYRAVGCHQCNNSGVQNGRLEMNSDWNIVTSDVSLDMSQGFTLSYELRWSPLAGVTSLQFGLWTPSNVCNSCCPSASCSQSWGHVNFNLSTGGVSLWMDGLELATGIMPAPALADDTWHSVEVSLAPAAPPCP